MGLKLSNNAVSRLAAGCSNVATSITLQPGEGALFPTLGGGDFFPVTISKADGTNEIVLCTARATDVLTITRAQETTTAKTFLSGDRVELRLTAAALDNYTTPAWASVTGKPSFATVATSGAYADLSGKPAISTVGASGVYADLTSKPTLGTAAALSEATLRQLPFTTQRTSAYVPVAADAGQTIPITTGGVTVNNAVFVAGDTFSIYNESDVTQALTQGSGVTLRKLGVASVTGSQTIPARGMVTVQMRSASEALAMGVV